MDFALEPKRIPLDELKPHPLQAEVFSGGTEQELEELVADLDHRGQQDPIHCCSDGTILCGHRRVAAARQLGWTEITAIIREDLGDPESPAAVDVLIRDNLMRRQMDDLALARCYRRLKRTCIAHRGNGNVRDMIAARLPGNQSGRTLDRLERLLELPRDIQDRISAGSLKKAHAEKLLKLAPAKREELIEELRTGRSVRDTLRSFGLMPDRAEPSIVDLAQNVADFFARNVAELEQHLVDLDQVQVQGHDVVEVLDHSVDFLTAWRDRKRQVADESFEDVRSVLGRRPSRYEGADNDDG